MSMQVNSLLIRAQHVKGRSGYISITCPPIVSSTPDSTQWDSDIQQASPIKDMVYQCHAWFAGHGYLRTIILYTPFEHENLAYSLLTYPMNTVANARDAVRGAKGKPAQWERLAQQYSEQDYICNHLRVELTYITDGFGLRWVGDYPESFLDLHRRLVGCFLHTDENSHLFEPPDPSRPEFATVFFSGWQRDSLVQHMRDTTTLLASMNLGRGQDGRALTNTEKSLLAYGWSQFGVANPKLYTCLKGADTLDPFPCFAAIKKHQERSESTQEGRVT